MAESTPSISVFKPTVSVVTSVMKSISSSSSLVRSVIYIMASSSISHVSSSKNFFQLMAFSFARNYA